MTDRRSITEGRLREALQRLLDGKPNNTKASGSLTLNKINREAKLGNSYIHKFPEFVAEVAPIIEKHNKEKDKVFAGDVDVTEIPLNAQERLRLDKLREGRLKERYRQERDDARKANTELEALNNSLMFKLYELQEDLSRYKVAYISDSKKPK